MARGLRHDPRRGEQRVGDWFRDRIASRGDLAESTRSLYTHLLARWIDVPLPLPRAGGRERTVHLGAQTLASVTPANVREWDAAVLAESVRRASARPELADHMARFAGSTCR